MLITEKQFNILLKEVNDNSFTMNLLNSLIFKGYYNFYPTYECHKIDLTDIYKIDLSKVLLEKDTLTLIKYFLTLSIHADNIVGYDNYVPNKMTYLEQFHSICRLRAFIFVMIDKFCNQTTASYYKFFKDVLTESEYSYFIKEERSHIAQYGKADFYTKQIPIYEFMLKGSSKIEEIFCEPMELELF